MSREKKYRAWDKVTEVYLYSDKFPSMWQFFKELENRGIRHWEIEDSTGLKDKNGKEIYEGDIVKMDYVWDNNVDECDEGYHIGEVVIIPSQGVMLKNPTKTNAYDEVTKLKNYNKNVRSYRSEIIGNIHENPELLEQGK